VVWNVASHHPDRCTAVASLCVPYYTIDRGLDHTLTLVDRQLYPENEFPAGQWEYMRLYEEAFAEATDPMNANARKFLKLAFRKGDPSGEGKRAATAMARKGRGMFGGANIPDVPRDGDVISEEDLSVYVSALERNGFFGPSSWYMNHETNAAYGRKAVNDGTLEMPVLFIAALYDYVCESVHSRLGEPMRKHCRNLTEEIIKAGHWVAQEKPLEVNAALVKWLATSVPGMWPRPA
jgi:pimeloyl-ACP methyl ester carboxylesterase